MRTGWLLRDGEVLASAEMAVTFSERSRGLSWRTGYEGAMVLTHARSVHTFTMRFALDVALCDADLGVLHTLRLGPRRLALPRRRVRTVIEAEAGSFERWGLAPGDHLEFRAVE
ncbi:MAG: DUF192 domain-containing protein [Acidimicrobiales bacterium]